MKVSKIGQTLSTHMEGKHTHTSFWLEKLLKSENNGDLDRGK